MEFMYIYIIRFHCCQESVSSVSVRMKSFCCGLVLLVVLSVATSQQVYTSKYDNIDLDEILNNERLYKKYFNCLINKGKCTPDGKELKGILSFFYP